MRCNSSASVVLPEVARSTTLALLSGKVMAGAAIQRAANANATLTARCLGHSNERAHIKLDSYHLELLLSDLEVVLESRSTPFAGKIIVTLGSGDSSVNSIVEL